MKKIKSLLLTVLLAMLLTSNVVLAQIQDGGNIEYASGKIIKVISEENIKSEISETGEDTTRQTVIVKVLNGDFQGEEVKITNEFSANPIYSTKVHANDRVLLDIETQDKDNAYFYISDIDRMPILLMLSGVMLLSLLIIAGQQDLFKIIPLAFNSAFIILVYVPLVANGFSLLVTTIVFFTMSTIITAICNNRISKDTLIYAIGSFISVFIIGVASFFTIKLGHLTIPSSEENSILLATLAKLKTGEIIFSTIIISCLGVINYFAQETLNTLAENKDASFLQTLKFAIENNRDKVLSVTNFIILLFVGINLPLVVLSAYSEFFKFINLSNVASILIIEMMIIFSIFTTLLATSTVIWITGKTKFTSH